MLFQPLVVQGQDIGALLAQMQATITSQAAAIQMIQEAMEVASDTMAVQAENIAALQSDRVSQSATHPASTTHANDTLLAGAVVELQLTTVAQANDIAAIFRTLSAHAASIATLSTFSTNVATSVGLSATGTATLSGEESLSDQFAAIRDNTGLPTSVLYNRISGHDASINANTAAIAQMSGLTCTCALVTQINSVLANTGDSALVQQVAALGSIAASVAATATALTVRVSTLESDVASINATDLAAAALRAVNSASMKLIDSVNSTNGAGIVASLLVVEQAQGTTLAALQSWTINAQAAVGLTSTGSINPAGPLQLAINFNANAATAVGLTSTGTISPSGPLQLAINFNANAAIAVGLTSTGTATIGGGSLSSQLSAALSYTSSSALVAKVSYALTSTSTMQTQILQAVTRVIYGSLPGPVGNWQNTGQRGEATHSRHTSDDLFATI
jgi:hypothetical protein